MAEMTEQQDFGWGVDQIKELENEIMPMVSEFIENKN